MKRSNSGQLRSKIGERDSFDSQNFNVLTILELPVGIH